MYTRHTYRYTYIYTHRVYVPLAEVLGVNPRVGVEDINAQTSKAESDIVAQFEGLSRRIQALDPALCGGNTSQTEQHKNTEQAHAGSDRPVSRSGRYCAHATSCSLSVCVRVYDCDCRD